MWVRVTCPNGHRVKVETRYLGRENRCPRCRARVYLWIQVVCPNGHTLRVQSKHAGRRGTCPECKQEVVVPDLTEVIAMETLGDSFLGTEVAEEASADEAVLDTDVAKGIEESSIVSGPQVPMRECPGCKAKIPKGFRTCPHCQKYLGDVEVVEGPASPAGRSVKCPVCGVTSFPGDTFCSSCGCPLE